MTLRTYSAITYAYDPHSPDLRYMNKHIVGQWARLVEMFAIATVLLFLYFLVGIAIRESEAILTLLHPTLLKLAPVVFWVGILLGIAATYMCGLLVTRLHATMEDFDRDAVTYRKGPITVTLDGHGITTASDHNREIVDWAAVRRVVSTPQGLALRLDNSNFVPIPDVVLPRGVTRNHVTSAVHGWRGRLV